MQWQVKKDDGITEYIDAHEEDHCNWMMFVRPATNPLEQNLVAYQHGNDIFFSVIKSIEPRQELKVSAFLLIIYATDWQGWRFWPAFVCLFLNSLTQKVVGGFLSNF